MNFVAVRLLQWPMFYLACFPDSSLGAPVSRTFFSNEMCVFARLQWLVPSASDLGVWRLTRALRATCLLIPSRSRCEGVSRE